LGEIYTKKGRYAEGLRVDKRLSKLRPQNPIVHYNLACSLSLLEDITSSFKALKRALELGYEDISFLNNDPDLLNLRRDKRFEEFIKK
jgi:predicted Zn-dependent protease